MGKLAALSESRDAGVRRSSSQLNQAQVDVSEAAQHLKDVENLERYGNDLGYHVVPEDEVRRRKVQARKTLEVKQQDLEVAKEKFVKASAEESVKANGRWAGSELIVCGKG